MAETLKVLGQSNPTVNELTNLYEVPISSSCTISSLVICNRSSIDQKFRVSVAMSGASDDLKQYLYYDHEIMGNTTFIATIGITLSHSDIVRIYSSGDLSFQAYGIEIS